MITKAQQRKDGKFMVTHCFNNGRIIREIITADQLKIEREKEYHSAANDVNDRAIRSIGFGQPGYRGF